MAAITGALDVQDAQPFMRVARPSDAPMTAGIRVFDPSGKAISSKKLQAFYADLKKLNIGAEFTDVGDRGLLIGNYAAKVDDTTFSATIAQLAKKHGLETKLEDYTGGYLERTAAGGQQFLGGFEAPLRRAGDTYIDAGGGRERVRRRFESFAGANRAAKQAGLGRRFTAQEEKVLGEAERFVRETLRLNQEGAQKVVKGFTEPEKRAITLLDNADVSTALHEPAHVWRRTIPEAQQKVIERWVGLDVSSRPTEDLVARALEGYLLEEKAPHPDLDAAFSRFRDWLSRIYPKVEGSETPCRRSAPG